MPKPFDATLKDLLERDPAGWAAFAGHPGTSVEIIDSDASTLTGASDKVLRVRADPDWLLDLNFQRGPDASLPRRMLGYGVVFAQRHEAQVRSVAVLIDSKANLSNLTGTYEEAFPGEPPHLVFRYQVIRVWQLPPEVLLAGGIGVLPLAPIGAVTEPELPAVVTRMKARLDAEVPEVVRRELWTAAYILMGLRYNEGVIGKVLEEVVGMEESSTYQAIIRKGKQEGLLEGERKEAREILLMQGEVRFGTASAEIRTRLQGCGDLDLLHHLSLRLLTASSWEDLLAGL
jgi:predicted transposase YdaD